MNTDTPASPPKSTARRWVVWILLILFLILASPIIIFAVWRTNLSHKVEHTLSELQSAGYPTTMAQLGGKYYPHIAEESNSARFFQNVFPALQITNNPKRTIPPLPDYQSSKRAEFFSPAGLELINSILASNRVALDMLHSASPLTNCRYPINFSPGYGTLLPHLAPLKSSAQILSLDAVVHARNRDNWKAIENVNAIFRIARTLDHEPFVISQLVRRGITLIDVDTLEYLLNSQSFTDAQLVALSHSFRDSQYPPAMEHALAGELCAGANLFQMSGSQLQASAPRTFGDDTGSKTGPASLNAGYGFLKAIGFVTRDYLFYLQSMQAHLQNASLPFPERLDAEEDLNKQISRATSHHFYFFSSLILPSMSRAYAKQCDVEARLNIVQTVLAIERYRLARQNQLPDKLENLVPTQLDAIPMDPFDGEPLRYKKLPKGYMIYSVGDDRKDDGGIYTSRDKHNVPSDITFVVER